MNIIHHELLYIGLDMVKLGQNCLAFRINRILAEPTVANDIAQEIHRPVHLVFETVNLERSLLPGRVRVHVRAILLHLHLQLLPTSLLRALEVDVFQEVCHAWILVCFIATAGFDYHAHSDHQVWFGLVFGADGYAVSKFGLKWGAGYGELGRNFAVVDFFGLD